MAAPGWKMSDAGRENVRIGAIARYAKYYETHARPPARKPPVPGRRPGRPRKLVVVDLDATSGAAAVIVTDAAGAVLAVVDPYTRERCAPGSEAAVEASQARRRAALRALLDRGPQKKKKRTLTDEHRAALSASLKMPRGMQRRRSHLFLRERATA